MSATGAPTAWHGARPPFLRRGAEVVLRRGSAAAVGVAVREARYLASAARLALELRLAARSRRPIVVGPFLGEVGFELLYWIPLVRALLERNRVDPERVTVVTRGGAGAWYAELAGHSVEILDLVAPQELARRLGERRLAAGDRKQLTVERLDRELISPVRASLGDPLVLHPLLMYGGLRAVHAGWRPVRTLARRTRYATLPRADVALQELPDGYVAVRLYESDCFGLDVETCRRAEQLVAHVADRLPVVALAPAMQLDDHAAWTPADPRVLVVAVEDPRTNLAVQAEIVRNARALVSTAGGFSYLGPLVGTPTLALHARASFNPVHLEALRSAFPHARYESAPLEGDGATAELLDTVLG